MTLKIDKIKEELNRRTSRALVILGHEEPIVVTAINSFARLNQLLCSPEIISTLMECTNASNDLHEVCGPILDVTSPAEFVTGEPNSEQCVPVNHYNESEDDAEDVDEESNFYSDSNEGYLHDE